jgi:hypothetical protein
MPNRIEARSAKAALTNATGRLPLQRLFSTPLINFGENQDSGCKLLKNRLRTAWHQQKSSKIVR